MAIRGYAAMLALLLIEGGSTQKPSPCPDVFDYDPQRTSGDIANDRWHGTILLKAPYYMDGVTILLELDHRADLIGNWFGEVTSTDNKDFTIKNSTFRLAADQVVPVRFFVKYNTASVVPSVKRITRNGKVICGDQELFLGVNIREKQPTEWSNTRNEGPGDDYYSGDIYVHTPPPVLNQPKKQQRRSIECGSVSQRPIPFISFSEKTTKGDWPWHAAIFHVQGPDKQSYMCGATLISDSHVVTAAHCVTKRGSDRRYSDIVMVVVLGKYNLKDEERSEQMREVEHIHVHPQYSHENFFNDIAILKMAQPAVYNDYVRPVCLWSESKALKSVVNRQGTVVGWGFNEHLQLSDNLRQASMPVVETTECIYSNRPFFSHLTHDKNFCAGSKNGTSVCNGDSGGGLFFEKKNVDPARWQIRGIVSVGVSLPNRGICDTSEYAIFTDVAQYLDWIKSIIG